MRRLSLLLPILAILLSLGTAAAQPPAPQGAPDLAVADAQTLAYDAASSAQPHRFPRPSGANWSSTAFCYDAVEPVAYRDATGAWWWNCYTKGPHGTGQYVVKSTETASALVELGYVPTARGGLSVDPLSGELNLVFHDAAGPGWVPVPGFVPRGPLYGVALPLMGR